MKPVGRQEPTTTIDRVGTDLSRPRPAALRPSLFSPTKFLVPAAPATLVSRPALVRLLDAGDERSLTIVVGSPGAGKSVLLGEWFRRLPDGEGAWLSADRGDADPTRFWRGVIAAVQQVEPTFGVETARLLAADGLVSPDALEGLLTDDARLERRIRLVIDDFQLVSPVAADQLRHLLERGLRHLRVLLGSRSDPAVGLHRLRLREELCEIREADLRLGLDETAELLGRIGVATADLETSALHARTEGWAAGVQLAALMLRASDDPATALREFTGSVQTIAGYLTAEVLSSQPDRIRRFLEDTCIVDELDASLGEALTTDDRDGHATPTAEAVSLQEIEEANLFLSRVDDQGSTFRYHQLFAEVLRYQLQVRHPARWREQHRRAAEWHLANDNISLATRHFWLAGDRDRPARLLRDHIIPVYVGRGSPPLADVRLQLTDDELLAGPGDVASYGLALVLNGLAGQACDLLERILTRSGPGGLTALDRVHISFVLSAATLQRGDTAASVAHAEEGFATATTAHLADDDWTATAIPSAIRACAWEGSFAEADALAGRLDRRRDAHLATVDLPAAVAFARYEAGRLPEAERLARSAHEAARSMDTSGSGPDVAARAVLGNVLVEQGRLDEGILELEAVVASGRAERIPMTVLAAFGLSRARRAQGDFDGALEAIGAARHHLRSITPGTTVPERIDVAEAVFRLSIGELDRAADLVAGLRPGNRRSVGESWIAVAQGRVDDAVALLAGAPAPATPRQELALAMARLRIAVVRGDADLGSSAHDALEAAEAVGFLLPIAEAGSTVLEAVQHAARHRPRTAFVERLLATRPLPLPEGLATPRFPFEELTARELEVLRYLGTSMSNQEIADALFLSVNTVKTHIKHVLRKLVAGSRAEAVQRARALHYL